MVIIEVVVALKFGLQRENRGFENQRSYGNKGGCKVAAAIAFAQT